MSVVRWKELRLCCQKCYLQKPNYLFNTTLKERAGELQLKSIYQLVWTTTTKSSTTAAQHMSSLQTNFLSFFCFVPSNFSYNLVLLSLLLAFRFTQNVDLFIPSTFLSSFFFQPTRLSTETDSPITIVNLSSPQTYFVCMFVSEPCSVI